MKYNKTYSICLLTVKNKTKCKKIIKTQGGSTSGLIRHFKNAHNIHAKILQKSKQSKLENTVKLFPECYEKDLIHLICKDLITPNNISTNAVLRKWCYKFWGINLPQSPKGIWYQLDTKSVTNYALLVVYHRSPASVLKTQLNTSEISQTVNIEIHEARLLADRQMVGHILPNIYKKYRFWSGSGPHEKFSHKITNNFRFSFVTKKYNFFYAIPLIFRITAEHSKL